MNRRSGVSGERRVRRGLVAAVMGVVVAAPGFAIAADAGDIVINEIMQNPSAVSDASGEWFELKNVATVPINVDGWMIEGGGTESHLISAGGSLVVPAGGFLVLGRVTDSGVNGGYTPDYVYSGITLGNGSDALVIRELSVAIDSVAWDDGATFPDPDGATMELMDPLADNALGPNWIANTTTPYGAGDFGTPGLENAGTVGAGAAPVIDAVQHLPSVPIETDTVAVRADVTDNLGVGEVCLEYRVNGGTMTSVPMLLTTAPTYEAKVPPQPAGTLVEYIVVASDVDGNQTTVPVGAPVSAFSYTVGSFALTISINEVLADPPTTTGDANNDGTADSFEDEFVELVNYGTAPVDISDWTLSDDDAPGGEFVFPAGTIVPPLGFVTLFGGGSPQGFLGPVFTDDGRVGNGLGNTGDTVLLKRAGMIVDVLAYGSEGGDDQSMIRVPDGTGDWTTPGDEGFAGAYSPQSANGGGLIATKIGTWGRIKAIFR